jgi:hypothetical protein
VYRTIEVRWFLPGEPDPAVAAWVNGGAPAAWTGRRRDVYLVIPGVDGLGLKLRGEETTALGTAPGRFEVKARAAQRAGIDLPSGRVAGRVEEWLKWSYVGGAIQPFVAPLLAHPLRVVVDKQRLRRKHDLASGPPFPRVAVDGTEVPRGAFLELTAVRVRRRPWWSLGLEAFGPRDDPGLEEAFRRLVGGLFRDCPRELDASDSGSYPGWLAGLDP